ncbi:MAG: (d)CMP kinase [Clostridia bacterium]|nr:(d)CMP kinase [Clostridia bacterium]
MKAIRGATTVAKDDADLVRKEVGRLMSEIAEKNGITEKDIVCVMMSQTGDIKSMYAAKAARECGFPKCTYFSSQEPDVEGSLKLCIRALVLAENVEDVRHVYLGDARILRLDLAEKFNIALDGPAGSGKSSLAKNIAKLFDILYLDTGAMYRAVALAVLRAGVSERDEEAVCALLEKTKISVEYRNGAQITMVDGEDVGSEIRTAEVSMVASTVSKYAGVRREMVALQREIAAGMSCVLDGRDIGTNVLPDAKFKFYIDATPEVRAERRLRDYEIQGLNENFEDILRDIKRRDRQDSTREIDPLRKADDAVVVDTSDMTEKDVLEYVKNIIQENL